MSEFSDARIATLEATVSALGLRVQQLENTVAIQSEKLVAKTARGFAQLAMAPDGPSYKPSSAPSNKKLVTKKTPTSSNNQSILLDAYSLEDWADEVEQAETAREAANLAIRPGVSCHKPISGPSKKGPALNGTPVDPNNRSILYDAYSIKDLPNDAERTHLIFIQKLHVTGINKEEICKRTMDKFPDLCKGRGKGTEEARYVAVWNTVELNTSRWAKKYI
ncbi:hypothetical protein MMC29_007000 [Sticta canariensis]|nr:hypothetical protein [Sticta canariensis]